MANSNRQALVAVEKQEAGRIGAIALRRRRNSPYPTEIVEGTIAAG